MIYTEETKKALKLCYKAHEGQVDKSDIPYVFHPFHLAEQMDDEESTVVALLHDVVEDTEYTIEDLKTMGFSERVIEALSLMTHEDSVPYMDYVRALSHNPIAVKVKLADLRHNMDVTRLDHEPTEKDLQRRQKYQEAEKILLDARKKESQLTRLSDAVFGLAIADALGVPYEFRQRGTFNCEKMTGHGTHNQPAGTWSDDTSMTIATAKSIKDNNGKINIEDIRKNFIRWERDEEFTANDELFDIGMATSEALRTGKPMTGLHDNGNGSLMRILPLAFTDCTHEEIRNVSAITHGHEISMQACVIYVHVARRLLAGEEIEDILPTLKYDKPFDRLCRLDKLSSEDIRSGGYVVDTLEAALWALVHKLGYRETVLAAINLGDDTDTVGAVTGGLAGIMYGLKGDFAKACMKELRNKELIRECLWG